MSGSIAVRIIGVGLAILPLVMSGTTMDPVLMPRFTFLAVMLFIVSPFMLLQKERETPALAFFRSTQAIPFYLFLVTAIISSIWAINGLEAVYNIGKDLLFFLFLLALIQTLAGKEERIFILIKGLTVAAFIIAGFGMVQLAQVYYQSTDAQDLYIVRSTMAHRNLLVSSMVLALPFLGFGAYYFKKFWKVVSLLTLFSASLLIGLLQSRTGWLAALVLIGFFTVTLIISGTRLRKLKLPLTTMIITVVVFTIGSFLIFYTAVPEEAANAELRNGLAFENPTEKDFTADERLFMWKATGRMINEQSLLGVGPGNWKIWFPKYGSDIWRSRQGMVQFQRPHNDYLWILSEQGIFGVLAYFFMGLAALYCGFKIIVQRYYPQQLRLLVSLILSGIMAYAVVSFFSFPRERMVHQVLMYSGFAIIFSLYFQQKRMGKIKPLKGGKLLATLIFVVSPILAYMGFQRSLGEVHTNKIANARVNSQWMLMLAESQAISDYRFYNIDPTSLPTSFYSGLALINLREYEAAKEELHVAHSVHPYNIHVVNNLASVYQLSGNMPIAINYYKEALVISPKYLDGALNLAAAYFNNNEVEAAYQTLKKYHKVFTVDGGGDERYKQYLLVIMQTARDNLADQQTEESLKQELIKLNEADFWSIHLQHLEDDLTLNNALLRAIGIDASTVTKSEL